jgi:hypothetical protein
MGREGCSSWDRLKNPVRAGIVVVWCEFCLDVLSSLTVNAMQCNACKGVWMPTGRLHRDLRLSCCGTGSQRIRGSWGLLGWAGPRGVYFAGCTDAVVGLEESVRLSVYSVYFFLTFSCFGEDSACRRERVRSEECRAADCRVGH